MKINKKLLPIKGHYFFFNAGLAPVMPYLSTYARQLGFSSASVGLIFTVLPICGLVAKPLFGIIADRFKIQKSLFLLFQIVTMLSFLAIYFIPESGSKTTVELNCGNGITVLKSCYETSAKIDMCKVNSLGNTNETSVCKMKCDMKSPKMWQTVCEHWHIPQYCYSNTKNIEYFTHIRNITTKDQCVYIASDNVTLDGYSFTPKCRVGAGYVDVNEPCTLTCKNQPLATLIGDKKANMTCVDEMMNFKLCANVSAPEINNLDDCKASCDLDPKTPWRLMEICEGWKADVADTCHPKVNHLPDTLDFDGTILLSSTISEHQCVYIQLNHIQLSDGSVHYPNCIGKSQYQMEANLFNLSCEVDCRNEMVNDLFSSSSSENKQTDYSLQFWLFFLMMIISWVGQAIVVTFADAICFGLLGTKISHFGRQRFWGSVGFGIIALLTGTLIDYFSTGSYKNYTVGFVLMCVFMCSDVVVSCFLEVEQTKMSMNILSDIGSLLTSLPILVFLFWTISVGLCTGVVWNFLFWHIEDLSALTCGVEYVKTLQGLASVIQTLGGEIPFIFVSGYVIKKIGHINTITLVLFALGVRLMLYSVLTNPWWILPIEMSHGITFALFYATMASYANIVSPPGIETTVQGLVGAVFEGVGASLGSFIAGRLYEVHGGWNTFRWFSIFAFIVCALHAITHYLMGDKCTHDGIKKGYTSVIRYGQATDAVYILEDMDGVN